jgi:transcriptional regulator with XRE-family HTH domain
LKVIGNNKKMLYTLLVKIYYEMIYLSVKEKEKYVLKLRKEENKTYREIAHELKISPREISRILKKDNGEIEEKERKKIVLSKTAQALQLYKKGKSPVDVAIKLDLSAQEANSLYHNFLYLNNLHHFIEIFKEFSNDSLQDLFDYYDYMKENGITKEEIVEAIKKSNDYSKIKEEYNIINDQLPELKRQRDFYISDNKLLISKNWELNSENNSLVSKSESAKRMLQSMENEINKKRDLLWSIENSEDYTNLKNKVEEQLNNFLNQKKELFKLAAMTILDIIKRDPKKDILISNILHSDGNSNSQSYFVSYEEKIAEIAADTLTENALEINTNNILK